MATNISKLFQNNEKRDALVQVVNLQGQLSPLTDGSPQFAQFAEPYYARVVPSDCLIAETYLIVETPMPTGALATVTVNGVSVFTDAPVDAKGAQRSTIGLGISFNAPDDVVITITGGTGDILEGDIYVATRTIEWKQTNGKYTTSVPMTPYE